MCLAAWMSTRARHTLIRKTMFTGRVTGDNSICLANWKIWCMHVRVCVCVCLHESTGSDWLVGWLFGWRLAYLLFFFVLWHLICLRLRFFGSKVFFDSFHKITQTREAAAVLEVCCFSFFSHSSWCRDWQKSFDILALQKRDRMVGKNRWSCRGFHATIKNKQ